MPAIPRAMNICIDRNKFQGGATSGSRRMKPDAAAQWRLLTGAVCVCAKRLASRSVRKGTRARWRARVAQRDGMNGTHTCPTPKMQHSRIAGD